MRCPFCTASDTHVIDSRQFDSGKQVRRRRVCKQCKRRFTSYEKPNLNLPKIVKSDQRREPFDENKLRLGIELSIQKRPIDTTMIDQAVSDICLQLRSRGKREISSQDLGELVMQQLRSIDDVAYIRYASIYRGFGDIQSFLNEAQALLRELPPGRADSTQKDLFYDNKADSGDGD